MYVVFDCDTLLQAMAESEKRSKIHTHSINMSTKIQKSCSLSSSHSATSTVSWLLGASSHAVTDSPVAGAPSSISGISSCSEASASPSGYS